VDAPRSEFVSLELLSSPVDWACSEESELPLFCQAENNDILKKHKIN
jgi:hypothetical protein